MLHALFDEVIAMWELLTAEVFQLFPRGDWGCICIRLPRIKLIIEINKTKETLSIYLTHLNFLNLKSTQNM